MIRVQSRQLSVSTGLHLSCTLGRKPATLHVDTTQSPPVAQFVKQSRTDIGYQSPQTPPPEPLAKGGTLSTNHNNGHNGYH